MFVLHSSAPLYLTAQPSYQRNGEVSSLSNVNRLQCLCLTDIAWKVFFGAGGTVFLHCKFLSLSFISLFVRLHIYSRNSPADQNLSCLPCHRGSPQTGTSGAPAWRRQCELAATWDREQPEAEAQGVVAAGHATHVPSTGREPAADSPTSQHLPGARRGPHQVGHTPGFLIERQLRVPMS